MKKSITPPPFSIGDFIEFKEEYLYSLIYGTIFQIENITEEVLKQTDYKLRTYDLRVIYNPPKIKAIVDESYREGKQLIFTDKIIMSYFKKSSKEIQLSIL